ncbi:MAG: potassium channel beta subunit family protein [Bacteroidia bacterium]
MEYRRLGKSGLQVSVLSLGSWLTFGKQIENQVAEELMQVAYENGVNFFDNAEIYSKGQSEIVMGNILKKMNWDRSTYLVSSKVFWGGDKPNQKGLSRKHVIEACHGALKRLQVEYLDMYFCHRYDMNTPIEETVRAMETLIQQGKILYWGTSEWNSGEIMEAHAVAKDLRITPPTMEQPQYHMFERYAVEVDYQRAYQRGLGTTTWSPLASGLLSGKYNDGVIPADSRLAMEGLEWLRDKTLLDAHIEKVRQLSTVAEEIGCTMPQLALAWCVRNPNVSTVILGASKVSQLTENLKCLEIVPKLTPEVLEKIENILQNKPSRVLY